MTLITHQRVLIKTRIQLHRLSKYNISTILPTQLDMSYLMSDLVRRWL